MHALKIDGWFVDGLRHADTDPVNLSIVDELIRMIHALDLEVTAEWVQGEGQVEQLSALGCDLGPGAPVRQAGPAAWVVDRWRRSIQ